MPTQKTSLVSPHKSPFDVDKAYTTIRAYEGFRSKPYKDTKGLWTIGVGHLIGDGSAKAYKDSPFYKKTISEDDATKLAKSELLKRLPNVVSLIGKRFFDMSPETQRELVASYYRGGITGSPDTLDLIRVGKYKEASEEFLRHDDYKEAVKSGSGVAKRMKNLSVALAAEKPKKASFEEAVEERMSP
jgi:GH24 family phage-related lysozyme (muramidase)|tara:strand:+ start:613 stop:1173 length:561 start_codon:yes stop_codon:yes gene_type:complete